MDEWRPIRSTQALNYPVKVALRVPLLRDHATVQEPRLDPGQHEGGQDEHHLEGGQRTQKKLKRNLNDYYHGSEIHYHATYIVQKHFGHNKGKGTGGGELKGQSISDVKESRYQVNPLTAMYILWLLDKIA